MSLCKTDGCKESVPCSKHANELPGSSLNPATATAKQVGGSYYQTPIQPWDFIVANGLGFLEGNAIKYIARHRKKNGREDLEKAIHYLQKALEVYYPKT